jgi:hypothetical protein
MISQSGFIWIDMILAHFSLWTNIMTHKEHINQIPCSYVTTLVWHIPLEHLGHNPKSGPRLAYIQRILGRLISTPNCSSAP